MSCLLACCCTFPPPHKAAGALLHQLCSLQFTTEHLLFLPLFFIFQPQSTCFSSLYSAFFHTHSQCGILLPQFCILPHTQPVLYCSSSVLHSSAHTASVVLFFPSTAFFHTQPAWCCSSPVLHSSTHTASVVLFFPSSAFFQFPQVLCSLTKCCVLSSGLCQ